MTLNLGTVKRLLTPRWVGKWFGSKSLRISRTIYKLGPVDAQPEPVGALVYDPKRGESNVYLEDESTSPLRERFVVSDLRRAGYWLGPSHEVPTDRVQGGDDSPDAGYTLHINHKD